jgi:hypothetical protein
MRMQSVYDKRRENLRRLIGQWGGPTSLSKKLGHANGSFLAQIAGPHPRREISERTARSIESTLGLTVGWLDQDHHGSNHQLNDAALAEVVRAVATCLRDVGLRPGPDVYASLVQLAYDRAKLLGRIDEPFITQIIGLTRGSGK